MGVLERINTRALALQSTKAAPARPPGRLSASASYERYAIPDPSTVDNQVTLYRLQTWIQNAIDIPAQMAASTPLNVLEMVGEETTPLKNHDFERLLRGPNDDQGRAEFLVATFSWLMATGNCYWWMNTLNETSPVDELWIIPTNQIAPVPDGNMSVKGYVYDPGDGSALQPLEAWEVCHFKRWNPSNKYVGLTPLEALAMDARGDLAAQRFNTAFYDKDNVKASGILAFADTFTKPGEWERLKVESREQHGGTKHNRIMMLRGVGAGGVQWLQTQLTQVDIQYLQQRQFTKEEIYDRLAPGLASALAINANEANSRTGQANLREMCIYPMHASVAETVARKILQRRYDKNLIAEFEDVRHKDRQLELSEKQEYSRTHTIDQINAKYYGEDPLDDDRGALFVAEIGKGMTDARDPADKPPPAPPPQFDQSPGSDAIAVAGKRLDLERWQRKAIKSALQGRSADVAFDPDYLTDGETMPIRGALRRAQSAEDVQAVFKKAQAVDIDALIDEAFDDALRIAGEAE